MDRCILKWPVWPVIGYPMTGAHPSMSIERLIVIGYHCNHLNEQLTYQVSAHQLIGVLLTIDYAMCNCGIAHVPV